AMTGGIVLLATLFNLVSDIVGGVRVTVLEEEVVERTISSTRRYVVRRPPTAGEAASDWDVDESEPSAERADGSADADEPAVPSDWSIDDEDDDTEDDDEQEAADVAAHERSRNADESADPTVETAAVQSDGDARPAG
ncbi:MAG: hypothetical protein HKN41_08595, partial [Ilumatobacter sp.]|nr:hypothetical protein [Ilumatobacter sp.]